VGWHQSIEQWHVRARAAEVWLAMAVCLAASAPAQSQTVPANPYRPNAADEDWTFLKAAKRTDFFDPIKYIPLGREDWALTLSGELRWRPEGFRIRETAARPATVDNYLLQRYLIGADVRLGRRARIFGELQSGLVNGKFQSPRPTDRNPADLHQAFFAWSQPVREGDRLTLLVGRQEIEIGSSRLISASPGLNVKRSFDGVVGVYQGPAWTVAGVGAELVGLNAGTFDDRPDDNQRFWGAAVARKGLALARSEFGVYYLGIDRRASSYAQGTGEELRHTAGARWNAAGARLDLNYDVIVQWGTFASAPIQAWAFATETGYRFPSAPWKPRLGLRTDVASGDRDRSGATLQSFNPLFPGNAYSGAVGLLGPTNLTDLTPGLTLSPRPGLIIGIEAPSYWRTSTGDGVYSTLLRVLFDPDVATANYVGTNPGVAVVWQVTRHLQFQGAITRFVAGAFLDRTFVSSGIGFYSITSRYRF
jgi:Alginate export